MEDKVILKRLLDFRESKNLTQKALGNILGVSQAQYNRIEKGENQLSYDGIIKLAYFYNTSSDFLLGITDDSRPYPRAKKKPL